MKSPVCALVAGSVLILAGRADATSQVELSLADCPALSEQVLREHLDLELTTLGLARAGAELLLRCEQTSVVIALGLESGERYPVEVRVELRDTARTARERLVALAASELLSQAERGRGGRAANVAPAARAGPMPARHPSTDTADTRERSVRPRSEVSVAANAGIGGRPGATLWGASLGSRFGLARAWSVLLDLRFERGVTNAPLADVRWSVLSGFAGAASQGELGPLRLSLGLGIRAGWLSLAADAREPDEGRNLTAPWAGLAAPGRLALDWGGAVVPFVGAEVGYVTLPVHGNIDDGTALAEQRGAWLAASIGLTVPL